MIVVKWIVRIVVTLVVLVLLVAGIVWARGRQIVGKTHDRPVPSVAAATDSASIQRGTHLAQVMCVGCHSEGSSLPLTGSTENFIGTPDGKGPGILYGPNLTPGGVLKSASDGQLARAIREGIGVDGRELIIMPSQNFRTMSDADLADLLGYLRAQPAVEHATPARTLSLLGNLIIGSGMFPTAVQPAVTGPVPGPAEDTTAAYGAYIAPLVSCRECHGADYAGRAPAQFGPPPGPSLLEVAHHHPRETFDRALRQGVGTDGRALDPKQMPWPSFSNLTDTEVGALYAYLLSLPHTAPN